VRRVAGRSGDAVVGVMLRETVRRLARRFIAAAHRPRRGAPRSKRPRAGQAFTLDLLGEACLSDAEPTLPGAICRSGSNAGPRGPTGRRRRGSTRRPGARCQRERLGEDLGLHPWLEPADPAGSTAAVKTRLRPILQAARACGAHIHVDMEDRPCVTHAEDFMELADEPEFRRERNLGIVLQALPQGCRGRRAAAHRVGERRGTPVSVRLVKGAYWDYETAPRRARALAGARLRDEAGDRRLLRRLTRLFLEHARPSISPSGATTSVRSPTPWPPARRAACRRAPWNCRRSTAWPSRSVRALTERGERVRI